WPPWCIQPWEFVPQSAECVLRFESLGINEDEVKDDICRSFGFALDPKRMSCIRYNGFCKRIYECFLLISFNLQTPSYWMALHIIYIYIYIYIYILYAHLRCKGLLSKLKTLCSTVYISLPWLFFEGSSPVH
uniref:Uncharacterized protein n=1 Tax=Parascaris univalens TaxID=6257 RepID=A0A914ZVI4_PARUN